MHKFIIVLAILIIGNEIERNAMQQAAVWVMIAAVAKLSDIEIITEE